ncbi:MAG: hypothetical protein KGJ78_00540 [Alphaproteobacteria bacterium]|nr:hypothetical protein [Alphaproteobacteria bacterium]
MSRFASITSELLARKGDAKPWQPATFAEPIRVQLDADHKDAYPPGPSAKPEKAAPSKRYALKLTASEYERLGIIAVKQNLSRQTVLRHAVQDYMGRIEAKYAGRCGCLTDKPCKHAD